MKEIAMPKLSDTMTEGTVVAWRKAVGAKVERGEVIAEVETDKATMELEAFASGELLEIRVPAGTAVPVGTVIGVIGEAGEKPAARNTAPAEPTAEAEPKVAVATESMPKAPLPESPAVVGGQLAAPVVRRRARELGIDLATVTGSGPGGRILLEDLDRAPGRRSEGPAAMPESPESPAAPVVSPAGEPLSRMRAAIARTVSESWHTIPHFSMMVEVRMDAAEQFLQRLKPEGAAVSPTVLLAKATALSLERFPRLNVSLAGDRLVIHPEINLGIVVRLGDGLLVPVLRDCAGLPLAMMAERVARLVERARRGQLSDSELTGGTFAISNLGMYGVDAFVALILPPMAAVLAVGAVRDAVVAEGGRPVVARMLTLTLSADHRLVDGGYAAEFLRDVKRLLENPAGLADH